MRAKHISRHGTAFPERADISEGSRMTLNTLYMKHTIIFTIAAAALLSLGQAMDAQTPKNVEYTFTEGSTLTMAGKLFPDTPNPYHRVDTVKHKGFTASENAQVRHSSGLMIMFNTNSTTISVKTDYAQIYGGNNSCAYAGKGYDLYIKKNGKWLWAASGCPPHGRENGYNVVLIKNMNSEMKECMLYLPLFSEEKSIQIGVQKGAVIEKGALPFRHRIGIFGSSFTHGSSTGRAGMAYPAQFSRLTDIQLLSLGCSGNCKLQPYFADALATADVDGFIFDAFSNPSAQMIEERLFPFIEKLQAAHPGKPLIFQQTIYRERRNFDLSTDKFEQEKIDMADSLMRVACKKYKDVYFIDCTNATDKYHDSSIDGTHPGDHGYTLWAESIRKPVMKILRKYGIN